MRTRGVIGQRIVEVRQRRFYDPHYGHMSNEVVAIVLENGWELRPMAIESDAEDYVELIVNKTGAKR